MPVNRAEDNDDDEGERASANGPSQAGAHQHGAAEPGPGLFPVEGGDSALNGSLDADGQPNGDVAHRTDSMVQQPGVMPSAASQTRRHDGGHSRLDQMKSKARSGRDEVRRNLEDKRQRFKVNMSAPQPLCCVSTAIRRQW